MDVVIFHSMYGLCEVERAAAARLRAVGHRVVVPDLFDGQTVPGGIDAVAADQVWVEALAMLGSSTKESSGASGAGESARAARGGRC